MDSGILAKKTTHATLALMRDESQRIQGIEPGSKVSRGHYALLRQFQLGGSTLRGSLDLLLPSVVVDSRNRTLGPLPLFTKR
jgi:hypothetical protein